MQIQEIPGFRRRDPPPLGFLVVTSATHCAPFETEDVHRIQLTLGIGIQVLVNRVPGPISPLGSSENWEAALCRTRKSQERTGWFSHSLWTSRFGGDKGILEEECESMGPFTVTRVAKAGFQFRGYGRAVNYESRWLRTPPEIPEAGCHLSSKDPFDGQHFRGEHLICNRIQAGAGPNAMREIPAVVQDANQTALGMDPDPICYFIYPISQKGFIPRRSYTLLVLATGGPV